MSDEDPTVEHEKHIVRRGTERWLDAYMEQTANENRGSVLTNYPNTGKSYGFHKAAAEREEKATILQPNRNLRAETGEKAQDAHGVSVEDLPSFPQESPVMDEDSQWYSPEAEAWYNRGMSPQQVFEALPDEDVPPVEEDEYRRKMNTQLDTNDLLMGDPVHAFLSRAIEDRHVAMDDIDPYSSFVNEFDLTSDAIQAQLMEYVEHHRRWLLERGVDIETVDQVTRPDGDAQRHLFDLATSEPSAQIVPETEHVTADTSRIIRVLARVDEGQRASWVKPAEHQTGAGTKYTAARVQDHVIFAGLPLNLKHARSLLMLTATPVLPVFEQVFEDLEMSASVNNTMTQDQRERYFDDILGADVVQTTTSSRFISGGSNVRPEKFRHTVEEIERMHGKKPLVISSKKALDGELREHIDELGVDTVNFANAVGTNEFGAEDLALVWGAPHYGDDYVERVAAFCGDHDAEAIREGPDGERVETHWSTETSQEIYENMCEGTVFQAMLRVGRAVDDKVSTIYVETDKIPDDIPRLEPQGRDMFRTLTKAERDVVQAANELGTFAVRELHEMVDRPRRTIYNVLERLVDEGAAEQCGKGKYGAEEFRVKLEAAAKGVVSESVKSDLNSIIMQKPHNLQERPPEVEPRERILRRQQGTEPSEIDPDEPGEAQLDLGVWQTG